MSDTIGGVVNTWLLDPNWQRVFKHTFDVFQDYTSYILVSVGLVCLSVRLLNTLGTGEVMCIVVGVQYNGTSSTTAVDPYPGGGVFGMLNYAQNSDSCITAIMAPFINYLPYILLFQAMTLIVIEKFTMRLPKIAQKVERFHKNIVEESLFGHGPDVAEDLTDPRNSTDAISRRRQRNEICIWMKRSSTIYTAYLLKNCVEIGLCAIFIYVDMDVALDENPDIAPCVVDVVPFPGLHNLPGKIFYQCQAKKMSFFLMALKVQTFLLFVCGLCCLGSILWCLYFRSVTALIQSIRNVKLTGKHSTKLKKRLLSTMEGGKDFLFLFDLLAHTCGLESTLRVLTHSDDMFYEMCKPKLDPKTMLVLEEDKLKIIWSAADIELWLQTGRKSSRQREIVVDSYEVTIFPAESVNNTHTINAIDGGKPTSGRPSLFFFNALPRSPTSGDLENGSGATLLDVDFSSTRVYSTWFYDLNGGRTEYVITIACMIGKSRMKGEKVVTNLVPYGPEKPRPGMVRSATSTQVELFWDPPKGDFTKFVLAVYHLDGSMFGRRERRPSSPWSGGLSRSETSLTSNLTGMRKMENLSHKLTTYTVLGLEPGEAYNFTLGTKTGNVNTRAPISDIGMTVPDRVRGFRATSITSSSCLLTWLSPESCHTCLKAYNIQVRTSDGKICKEMAVPSTTNSFGLTALQPEQDYEIFLSSVCVFMTLRTESEKVSLPISTLPESEQDP